MISVIVFRFTSGLFMLLREMAMMFMITLQVACLLHILLLMLAQVDTYIKYLFTVRCADLMMTSSERLRTNICAPFFFVNIADCDVLSRQVSYIACKLPTCRNKSGTVGVYLRCKPTQIMEAQLAQVCISISSACLRQQIFISRGPNFAINIYSQLQIAYTLLETELN